MRSARRFYRLSVGLGAAGALAAALAVAVAVRSLDLAKTSPTGLLQACRDVVFSGQTAISALVLGLTGTGLSVLVLALRSTVRNYRAQRRVLSRLPLSHHTVYRGVPLSVFAHDRPEAFCAGLLRPRVYLSSAALHIVQDDQLTAVIEHEAHHCRRHDPLRILIVQILSDALFFLPVMSHMRERYRALAELAADEAAITRGAHRTSLAAALLAFAESPPTTAGVVGIAPERVDHLLGQSPRWQLPAALLSAALVTLAALAAITLTLMQAAPQGLGIAALGAQTCMIAMVALPLAAGSILVLIARRSRQDIPRR